ncbi:DUF1045 domain-containing protein [Sulfitobacter aestuariivivens]|uniref:DUF1045 domain-containing protein n=1 Tax=Sulfitobacter aestuariivivens TaxID=2766981 RepID=A0A927D8K4_9RHOB|nr:DUF1045 domain-containing protein [Sulfitobacter aestuariivivens]MBD3665744.1 DUF1045 domain-containing protein [Sulfitobacter aestuariivivens]
MSYSRFAIYYVPPDGALAEAGAAWLGWDVATGREIPQPSLPGLRDITMTPKKYGFHGTLKPPFRLKDGTTVEDLENATSNLAASLAPAACEGLKVTVLNRFLALTPCGDLGAVRRISSSCVRDLDGFRAPAGDTELARHRKAGLTPLQETLLTQWGYPYVMEAFKFHLTLTGRLPEDAIAKWSERVKSHLPASPAPFVVDQIALCGERADGRFEMLHRYTFAG